MHSSRKVVYCPYRTSPTLGLGRHKGCHCLQLVAGWKKDPPLHPRSGTQGAQKPKAEMPHKVQVSNISHTTHHSTLNHNTSDRITLHKPNQVRNGSQRKLTTNRIIYIASGRVPTLTRACTGTHNARKRRAATNRDSSIKTPTEGGVY